MKANVRTLRNFHTAQLFSILAVTTKIENNAETVQKVQLSSSRWLRYAGTRKSVYTELWPERLSNAEKHAVKTFIAKANRREYEENNSVFDICNGHYCEYTR